MNILRFDFINAFTGHGEPHAPAHMRAGAEGAWVRYDDIVQFLPPYTTRAEDWIMPYEARHAAANPTRTLRDWFAGMSMQGMLASPELMVQVTSKAEGGEGPPLARLARVAYRQADLLLAERDREEPSK